MQALLRTARLKKGFTLTDVGSMISDSNYPRVLYEQIESGRTAKGVKRGTLVKIALALDIDYRTLVGALLERILSDKKKYFLEHCNDNEL